LPVATFAGTIVQVLISGGYIPILLFSGSTANIPVY
jgi:hypothetical protein